MPGDRGRATQLTTPSCRSSSSRGASLWQKKSVARGMSSINWKHGERDRSGAESRNGAQLAQERFLPLLRQLSDLSDSSVDDEILLRQGKLEQQELGGRSASAVAVAAALSTAGEGGATAKVVGGGAAVAHAPASGDVGLDHGRAADGVERVRLDAERQILLTMLLAHMCSEHDATPRTFVEQVLVLYEAKVLDSIQFLFDLGFVPPVALPSYRTPPDRAAVVEAVRRQINLRSQQGDPLLLEAWPSGPAAGAAAASGGDDGVGTKSGKRPATPLGLRVLGTSRYLRDFEEEGLIARGSFGDVYRTRHRLDGTRYAIKKVVFRGIGVSNPRAQAVMREVQCLAQLDHKNIVRYHTSWLESSWVENGMGHRHTDSAAAAATTGADVSLRERMDALVPAHKQSQLIKDLETMVRSGCSASGSGSGWGWGPESDTDLDGDAGFGAARRTAHQRTTASSSAAASLSGGGGLLWGSRGGDYRGSMSPQVRSPKNLIVPLNGRDRGFSRWSAEDLESETSRWSEASSYMGFEEDPAGSGGGGGGAATAAAAASRFREGGGGGCTAPSARAAAARRWAPPPARTLRAEQFRNPSIDMDDLVSFRNSSSPNGGGGDNVAAAQGVVEDSGDDASNDGWPEWEMLGGGVGAGVGGRGRGRGTRRDSGGRGRGSERRIARHSVSPDRLTQYPVTLYIQMTLCPSETLQDWLRNRNSRLSSEGAGSGVLFEDGTRTSRAPPSSSPAAASGELPRVPADDATTSSIPAVLLPNDIDSGDGGDDGRKAGHGTPVTSPRTDPVTSASSGDSDRNSENSSSAAGSSTASSSISGGGEGTVCPPPTREISLKCEEGESSEREAFSTTPTESEPYAGANGTNTRGAGSPARSVSSETGSCDGRGVRGVGSRVDLHEALRLFRQLAEGVAHIHSKGIIHRDLKPENVFVGEDDCLKIGDFGLSRTEAAIAAGLATDDDKGATTTSTTTTDPDPLEAALVPRTRYSPQSECHTTGVGTASYASPEQLQGRRYGVRSDLFSLGLILLELCCSFTTTHERADAFQSMRQPGGSAPSHLAKRSPAVARLADLLCRTVPEQRPSAAKVLEMLDALDGRCGCEGCPGGIASGGERRGGRSGSGEVGGGGGGDGGHPDDMGLREELAAKTRKVEEQEVLIGELQRKLTQLSRNPSPAVGPVNSAAGGGCRSPRADLLDIDALGLGLAALKADSCDGDGGVDVAAHPESCPTTVDGR